MSKLVKSNLGKLMTGTEIETWHKLKLSPTTRSHRAIAKLGMDDFTSFTWRGVDAFEVFGAFILTDKNSLKFYNGPTYSNSYTKPQFDSAYGQLTGITFNIQKIDFVIGVYWISEEHYRQLIYWLNPYEINTLTFGFEPNYYYQVKLASVEDGIRYIVGHEENKPMYYTEMKLSFEVQGPSCAYHIAQYELEEDINGIGTSYQAEWGESYTTYKFRPIEYQVQKRNSDINIPIECLLEARLITDFTESDWNDPDFKGDKYSISLEAQYDTNKPISLFDITFKNQTYSTEILTANSLSIKYESDSGLLLLNVGDSEYMLLNQLSTSNYGKRIVDSIIVNKFEIPGLFDSPDFDMLHKLKFKVIIRSNVVKTQGVASDWISDVHFNIRARTNLI